MLAKYNMPTSPVDRRRKQFLTFYLYLGLMLPAAEIAYMLAWFASVISYQSWMGVVFSVIIACSGIGVLLLILMTPIALVGIIAQRRWSILPLCLGYGLMVACGAFASNFYGQLVPILILLGLSVTFAAITTTQHLKLIRQIKNEPNARQPKVIGCGSELHEIDKSTDSSESRTL